MKLSVIRKRSEGGGGAPARAYTNGSSTSAPDNGTGNDGDVYFSTQSPYPVFQKQDGAWIDVRFYSDSAFSKDYSSQGPAQKYFYLDGIHAPSDGDVLIVATMSGSVTIEFYAPGETPEGMYTTSVEIGPGMAMQVVNGLMGYSATVTTSYGGAGEHVLFETLEVGSDAYISWNNTGSGVFGNGTVNGGDTPGAATNGPFTIRNAVPGSRHILRFASVGAYGEGNSSLVYRVFSNVADGDVLASGTSAMYDGAHLGLTPLGMFGVPNAAVVVRQEGNLPDGGATTLTVHGYTLKD